MINTICIDCAKYGKYCKGTECQAWTGCVRRETVQEMEASISAKENAAHREKVKKVSAAM